MSRLSRHWLPETLTALLWILPLMIPYGAGLWWLYEQDYMIHWLILILFISLVMALVGRIASSGGHDIQGIPPDENAADAEKRARETLQNLIDSVTADDLDSAKDLERLLRRVLSAVAGAWNPGSTHAELRFTLPEALALSEHLSSRLGTAIREDLPILQHVQIAHAIQINRGLKPAQGIWKIYRVGRFLFNPVGSVVAELRRGVLQSLTPLAVESIKTKAAALLVRETGESAILLYSGRLRREMKQLTPEIPVLPPEPATGPLTLLITGKPNAGKSSFINALSGTSRILVSPLPCEAGFTPYALEEETAGELILIDSPGLEGPPGNEWMREAARADLVIWVAAAHRADRAVDQQVLQALRAHYAKAFRSRRAPILLVLTHCDRLDPVSEWSPSYDTVKGTRPKEQNIQAALGTACQALGIVTERATPVMVRDPEKGWNLETFWTAVHANLSSARQARLERLMLRRSRMEGVSDAVRTLPGLIKRLKKNGR